MSNSVCLTRAPVGRVLSPDVVCSRRPFPAPPMMRDTPRRYLTPARGPEGGGASGFPDLASGEQDARDARARARPRRNTFVHEALKDVLAWSDSCPVRLRRHEWLWPPALAAGRGAQVLSRVAAISALLAVVLESGTAEAQSARRWSVQGFGGAAFADLSSDGRWAEAATKEGELENYSLSLSFAAEPVRKLALRTQGFVGHNLRGQTLSLDYAFGEYAFSPALKLRAGKVLSPFGLYSEIYDVGTLRPFYYLPQFYQGRLGLIPKGYFGAGLTGARPLGSDWEIGYDFFGGQMRFAEFTTARLAGVDTATRLPIIDEFDTELVGSEMVGGRLLVASPIHGLDFGVSSFYIGHVEQQLPDGSRQPYITGEDATFLNGRLQYQRGGFTARSELFKVYTEKADVTSYYVEVSQKLFKRFQIAAQYENSDIALLPGDNTLPPPLRVHRSYGLALNYWITPDLVVKLNGYHVEGNMLNRPHGAIVSFLKGTLEQETNVLVLGTQFSF
jgi:hypothetical protein